MGKSEDLIICFSSRNRFVHVLLAQWPPARRTDGIGVRPRRSTRLRAVSVVQGQRGVPQHALPAAASALGHKRRRSGVERGYCQSPSPVLALTTHCSALQEGTKGRNTHHSSIGSGEYHGVAAWSCRSVDPRHAYAVGRFEMSVGGVFVRGEPNAAHDRGCGRTAAPACFLGV